jgi:hypothetical protein
VDAADDRARTALADLLPQGRLVEIDDGYTLIPLDRRARLAQVIREFVRAASPV